MIIGIAMSILFLGSIMLGVIIPLNRPKITVNFHPSMMRSYPGNIAWLVAEVESDESIDFEVETDLEIPIESNIWSTSISSYIIEIFLHPTENLIDKEIGVNLFAITSKQKLPIGSSNIQVINWTSQILSDDILNIRNQFLNYIEANTSFTNINSSTNWNFCGTVPILIVEHYLFKSEFWEMEISRHVMIQPHDWIQVYLRPRNQANPAVCLKVDSWGGDNSSIYEIEPPSEIFR